MVTEHDVMQKWRETRDDEERILFVVGAPGSGKSAILRTLAEQDGWMYMEAKDLLDGGILEYPREERPQVAKDILMNAITSREAEVVIIDSIDILFAPILNLSPVELLRDISQAHPLVVGWKGALEGDSLYLEHNNNPKYYEHKVVYPNHIVVIE